MTIFIESCICNRLLKKPKNHDCNAGWMICVVCLSNAEWFRFAISWARGVAKRTHLPLFFSRITLSIFELHKYQKTKTMMRNMWHFFSTTGAQHLNRKPSEMLLHQFICVRWMANYKWWTLPSRWITFTSHMFFLWYSCCRELLVSLCIRCMIFVNNCGTVELNTMIFVTPNFRIYSLDFKIILYLDSMAFHSLCAAKRIPSLSLSLSLSHIK